MKTYVVVVILLLVISACQSDIPTRNPPQNPISSPPVRYVQITAQLTPHLRRGNGGDYWEWRGRATTNLLGEVNLSLSHLAQKEANGQQSAIRDGFLYLWTDDYRSNLSGDYIGLGRGDSREMNISGTIEVLSGRGAFAAENGLLNLSITNLKFPSTGSVSDIQINGYLTVPATETVDKH